MTQPRCDGCKFWDDKDSRRDIPCVALCTKAKEVWECTKFDDESFERVLKPEFADLKMFVQEGGYNYMAFLYTRADFYCAHHEKKG